MTESTKIQHTEALRQEFSLLMRKHGLIADTDTVVPTRIQSYDTKKGTVLNLTLKLEEPTDD